MYSEKVMDHFTNPRNVGEIADASGVGTVGNAKCGDIMRIYLKIENGIIEDVKFKTFGCGAAIATSSMATEMVKGKSIEEVRDWAEANKLKLCHQFTVDDLHFLKRGGRISATTAVVGSMLKIKPVLHVDNEGRLINIGKARGRAASLKALVDKMEQTAIDPGDQTVFISHGDCLEDAQMVAQMVRDRFGVKDVYLNYVGPVIGAHSGPGTLALFYVGIER